MNRFISFIAVLAALIFASCEKTSQGGDDVKIDVQLEIPATITLNEGDTECSFRVMFNKTPLETDKIAFENAQGKRFNCRLTISGKSVKVTLQSGIVSGSYKVYLIRGTASLLLGETSLLFQSEENKLNPATTVYGIVSCNGEPVKGVVVSDGFEVVTTDDNGLYQLKSKKYHGYVFISVPSGYEVKSEGVFPIMYKRLKAAAATVESADFDLVKVDGQDNHTMIFMGDMHLARRNNDMNQFSAFTDDINRLITSNSGKKVYGLTLGDMTWDLYWSRFDLKAYKDQINYIKGMQIFQTMGNHDYDMSMTGDFATAVKYKEIIAPTYYSFNIGKVHYIVLDDIDCTNDGTESGRDYTAHIVDEQIQWLEKDLKHVSKGTPVVLAMHAPLNNVSNKNEVISLISPYQTVHVVSGHTHKVTNYIKAEYMEHVSGAVCADWWWSGNITPGVLLGVDGAPAGYAVWDIEGTDFEWRFQATGKPKDYQFRTYDLNNVSFAVSDLSGGSENDLANYASAYPPNANNEVIINVWNWNDRWKISVTDESGNTLETSKGTAYDPLHIAARFTGESTSRTRNFSTEKTGNFFKVKAGNADMDLTIRVEDEFGNVYTETMQRPKAFSTEAYK